MPEFYDAKDVLTGTEGECWINGYKFAEAYGAQAKISFLKEDVPMCGKKNGKGKRQMGWEGTASFRFNYVDSYLLKKQSEALKKNEEFSFDFISKVSHSSRGTERVILRNCTFDDLTLFDWEANKLMQREVPFTFDDYDVIDTI